MALTKISRGLLDTGVSDSSDATAITIDSSEQVGIGTATMDGDLHVMEGSAGSVTADGGGNIAVFEGNGNKGISILTPDANNAGIFFGSPSDAVGARIVWNYDSNLMSIGPDKSGASFKFTSGDGAESMRIDSSGNLLVGQTSLNYNAVGSSLASNGYVRACVDGGLVGAFNRKSSFGSVINLYKDGTSNGTIGAYTTSRMYIGSGDTGLVFAPDYDAIYPVDASTPTSRDNAIDLGYITVRFDDVYATNGTIQTSDQNEKNTIANSDLGLDFVKQLSPKSYKFNGKTRTHYGLIAQDVETVLSDINKPTTDFAGFIKGDISEEQDGSNYRYGLRYTEFISPLIKAIQEQQEQIEALQAKVEALENG